MTKDNTLTMDGAAVAIEGERNLLELARKASIDIPTFCYHSDLSVYGACRLCLVDVEGRGVVASCSTAPEPGMVVRTHTPQIREIRKIAVELLLANHEHACPTCSKSRSCQLQDVARRLGVSEVRFKSALKTRPIDASSPSLVRDPNKCILCGDCVRMCHDVQSVGAIDFAHRGADVAVGPAFGRDLDDVECVHCGQCARVCPTGALTPANDIDDVWAFLDDPDKVVVAQIAPAVRVALGEMFAQPAGAVQTGKIVAALKALGFDYVYDTSFAADLTVLEEATEFLRRWSLGQRLPQFTSCCPAWVKFAEQYYPELLGNLSTCKSPQQMFGSLAKDILPAQLGVKRENLVVVSIMPCTAKKFERARPEFAVGGQADVDVVLTTQELGKMIDQAGIVFAALPVQSLDMPLGFKTGAAILFGTTGGVSEAVLRYAAEKATGTTLDSVDFHAVRGEAGIRLATVELGERRLTVAIAHGLANARRLADQAKAGPVAFDLVEVMACPGGCIGGAGQPVTAGAHLRVARAAGLYEADRSLQLRKSQDNPLLAECYQKHLGEVGGHKAHELLHTGYHSRRRMFGEHVVVESRQDRRKLEVAICIGTSCHVRGGHTLLRQLGAWLQAEGLGGAVEVTATFCMERCGEAPNVLVDQTLISGATLEKIATAIRAQLSAASPTAGA